MIEVLIIGAGPAGLAAAITAKRIGYKNIVVVEKSSEAAEKVCGDGLTMRALQALNILGITVEDLYNAGANEINRSVHIANGSSYTTYHPKDSCVTLRRSGLSKVLRNRAISLGIDIRFNTSNVLDLKAGVVVDASGCSSALLRDVSLPMGISAILKGETDLDSKTWYFFHESTTDNPYSWIFPLSSNLWNVGLWQKDNLATLRSRYVAFEHARLTQYFKNWSYLTRPRGALLGIYPSKPIIQGAILCGDAAGSCDGTSGEGISNALWEGIFLEKQLVGGMA